MGRRFLHPVFRPRVITDNDLGKCLAVQVDVTKGADVEKAVAVAVKALEGLVILNMLIEESRDKGRRALMRIP